MHSEVDMLGRGFSQSQLNGCCDGTSVKPAVGIDTDYLAVEVFKGAWLLN